jgi:GNAT superfamily N-acetyltransferase
VRSPAVRPRLPRGLAARPATFADVDAVTELVAAYEVAVMGVRDVDREDIVGDWRRPSVDLERQTVVVFDGDHAVGEAEVTPSRGRAEVAVHPSSWGRGIGSALLEWTEVAALDVAGGPLVLGQTINDADERAASLLVGRGYRPRYESWVLGIDLDDAPPPVPALPVGISAHTLDPERDAVAVHGLLHEAFSEWPDWSPLPFEDWRAMSLERSDFDASLSTVLERSGEIVGVVMGFDLGGEGWVDQLAVRRDHRGRGNGRALLELSFRRFHERGVRSVGLNTDSRTGALGMYERVGMRIRRSYANYARALDGAGA